MQYMIAPPGTGFLNNNKIGNETYHHVHVLSTAYLATDVNSASMMQRVSSIMQSVSSMMHSIPSMMQSLSSIMQRVSIMRNSSSTLMQSISTMMQGVSTIMQRSSTTMQSAAPTNITPSGYQYYSYISLNTNNF